MEDLQLDQAIETATRLTIEYAPKVILAIITLIVGIKLIKILSEIIHKGLKKNSVDPSLVSFLDSFTRIGLKILLFISIASMLGVETTSFLTVLGAGGLAVGLSLQGSLSNLAGGVLILLFKPFEVGDFIEAQDHSGTVRKIQIFYTQLITLDNERVIIPNGNLSNNSIKNYSTEENLRIELNVGISYDSSIEKAEKTIRQVLSDHPEVLDSKEPFLGVSELDDSSVNIRAFAWTKPENFILLPYKLYGKIKEAFDENNISIPYPHRTVIMKNTDQ